ncbi:hypothetical protein Pint_12584 [Pistacia integerrima]|uniref:Uncharacterized protein n=1 Tax=Pistacia integerrima TaxID=434235 RepID=A0ACC0Y8I7_9ROSI|nr:hypothetical protein Pint_12584 [Pistacia integerrima]
MSKMLFFAIMMNCLDPTLTLACVFDYRDSFTLPMLPNENKRAIAAKFELASLYGGRVIASDHSAFESLEECKTEGNGFIPKMSQAIARMHMCQAYYMQSLAGLYPMVARLRPPHKNGKRFVETASGARVRLHPHSINFKLSFKKTEDCP